MGSSRHGRMVVACVLASLAAPWALGPAGVAWARDADIELGGPGTGKGKFVRIRDIAFDAAGRLYVLDGGAARKHDKDIPGNDLVQRFSADGKFLSQFSVRDEALGKRNDATRLAVDGAGNVYVTQPRAGAVQQFSSDGKLLRKIEVPGAFAIAVQKAAGTERLLVAAQVGRGGRDPIGQLEVILPSGLVGPPLTLTRKLVRCDDLAVDGRGNIHAHAETLQVYKFDPAGKHVLTIGAGTRTRIEDGSELWHTVTVDSAGRIYSMASGRLVVFDAGLTTVTRRYGQFTWYDPWSPHSCYTVLAVDAKDRLWVATSGYEDGKGRYHKRPVVLRVVRDFFGKRAETHSALLLGLNLAAECRLPYHVGHSLEPTEIDFVVRAGTRRVRRIAVSWHAYDTYKAEAASGTFGIDLEDRKEARRTVRFTPPRWGWYTLEFHVSARGKRLTGIGTHVGFTPRYAGLPALKEGESKGGWEDPARQAFAGLMLLRAHPRPGQLDKLEGLIEQCKKYGVTLLAQFTGKKEATPEFVRKAVTRFKGRIRYWEIVNEPNFSFKPAEYVALCRRLYGLIKEIDPSAKVLAPTVCGVQLPWYRAFYASGGAKLCDILSIHDYEGHESADPFHWRRKLGDLRKLMAAHGDADKPVWQTERGIPGVRADCFLGPTQAVRVLLQRNLLAALGIPSEHNLYYYLNQSGFGAYPAYLWSHIGPHPGALALRTRHAETAGRALKERLDFGPSGNKAFLGLRYVGTGGETIVLQNLGTPAAPLELAVTGAGALTVVDAFGNEQSVPVRGSKARVMIGPLPVYLRPAKGQTVTVPRIDFGRNLAPLATFSYSGKLKAPDTTVLSNGIFESPHAGYPTQYKYLEGEIAAFPQYLNITFPNPRAVNRLVVYSLRADNMQTALLDYDVQHHDGRRWVTCHEVRTPMPASSAAVTPQCKANTWYRDTNFFINAFPAVTASRFRLVIRRTTRGLLPDTEAERITGKDFGPRLHLREIEIYGPAGEAAVRLTAPSTLHRAALTRKKVTVVVGNRSAKPLRATARVKPPAGWKAQPPELTLQAPVNGSAKAAVELLAPESIPAGAVPVDVELRDPSGRLLDFDRLGLQFLPAVAIAPQSPDRIDETAQPMRAVIRNVGPSPARGMARLRVSGLGGDSSDFSPPAKAFGPLAPGASATIEIPVSGLKLLGKPWRVAWSVTANRLVSTVRQDLAPVRAWNIVGPFPHDEKNTGLHTAYAPEKRVDLSATYDVYGGKKAGWKLAVTDARGYLPLSGAFGRNTFVCAYAVAYVHSPAARKAILAVGWDDGFKMWLNGKLLAEDDSMSHGAKPGDLRAAAALRKGWNEVLLKVTQAHGGWGFYFDVLSADGKPMKDVSLAPSPGR